MAYNFSLIGAAGYIAPRHLQAIKDTGNNLSVAFDKSDSVGILDRYFDSVDFFTDFERYDRHLEKLRRAGGSQKIDYVSICSPNYLHDAHIRSALRVDAHAICEKPLVLNPWNIELLKELEQEHNRKVYTVLQLRLHDAIIKLKQKIQSEYQNKKANIDLTYITSRGKWYFYSWKGFLEKSGGIETNIGVHFFDMLLWIFGPLKNCELHYTDKYKSCGFLELEKANVRWFLSLDKKDLPEIAVRNNKTTYRSLEIDSAEFEFSEGFTELHTLVYKDIMSGGGFGLDDAYPSIDLVHRLRTGKISGLDTEKSHKKAFELVKNNG